MREGSLVPRFGRARRDPELAVLEGLHPLKHALRFGASVLVAVTPDEEALARLAAELAPDVRGRIAELATTVGAGLFARLAPLPPSTGVIAIAQRPAFDLRAVLAGPAPSPVVLLEDPRDLGNLGACVRVAAAAGAHAVLSSGSHDPWHPDALRGAAGLHFALPVGRVESVAGLAGHGRPLIALDPEGEPLRPGELDPRAILAFGSERRGISDGLARAAEARVRIPMREGVSSLNLATSVAAVLFSQRLAG